jgi:hypothetical protein
MYVMVFRPVSARGSRSTGRQLLTASMPVYVPPPRENAFIRMNRVPQMPTPSTSRAVAREFSTRMSVAVSPWANSPQRITPAWVTTNAKKIGVSVMTDSRSPRRLSTPSIKSMPSAAHSLYGWYSMGKKLNAASDALATLMAIVRM